MTLTLYYHPFSSYCQKAETAFYEKGLEYEGKLIDGSEPVQSELAALRREVDDGGARWAAGTAQLCARARRGAALSSVLSPRRAARARLSTGRVKPINRQCLGSCAWRSLAAAENREDAGRAADGHGLIVEPLRSGGAEVFRQRGQRDHKHGNGDDVDGVFAQARFHARSLSASLLRQAADQRIDKTSR